MHTDSLSQIMEAACEVAIERLMRISDVSPRCLLTARESAQYFALGEREIYNMISDRQLAGVRHGKRVMIGIRDFDEDSIAQSGVMIEKRRYRAAMRWVARSLVPALTKTTA